MLPTSRGPVTSARGRRCRASVGRTREPPPPLASRTNKVLARRNPPVVAVGAWVEVGQDFPEHPCALALQTDEIQAERRRENDESLQRFQDEVRHRVAQQAQVSKRRRQPVVKHGRQTPQQDPVRTRPAAPGVEVTSARGAAQQRAMERSSQESSEGMGQVRLRLAACRMIPHGEMTSNLPGGEWNISPSRHKAASHRRRAERGVEEDVNDEEEEEEGEDHHHVFTTQHKCPLVQQKLKGSAPCDSDDKEPDAGSQSDLVAPRVLWPLTGPEDLKRQRQSQFLQHRRQYMDIEREQVKENRQNRKHLKRTARIKAEKEQIRQEEERKLDRVWQLAEARQKLEERELLVLERLRLEEEERAAELQRRKKEERGKVAERYVEALRAQMKERLSQEKLDLPPLCCCASSFWDSHPDTCANNCIFHDNPKAYAKALHSTLLSLDLQ